MSDGAGVRLGPLWRSRSQQAACLVAALLLGGLGFLPLLGGPGYEASLIAGVIVPGVAAAATAIEVALARPEPLEAVGRGAARGFSLALVALGVALLHGARVGFCDPLHGLVLMALGGGFGAVMGGVWGGAVGSFAAAARTRRRRIGWALGLAIAGPVLGALVSLWRFFTSPMVFAFDPFFGYFGGPLYDTVIEPVEALVSYRAGSLLSLLAVGVAAFHLRRKKERLELVWRGRPGVVLCGALALGGSLAITLAGDRLGHWSTSDSIRRELGRSLSGERCDVVYAPSVIDRDAALFAGECDAHVRDLERWFGVPFPHRIVAYLFESPAQKGRLMGAATTYIAKPWRREVYLQFSRYPHPVLGHELAHVVAGAFGQGPFRVAGPLFGIVPDPGRIEGVATAAAPDEDWELTLQQWARTMLDLERLPPLERVFRLAFLAESSATAYTVAGAFVDWLHRTRGAEAVRRWYGGEPLERIVGKSLTELDGEWRAALRQVDVPAQALETARARFERPAIFQRRCPHVVDALVEEGSEKLGHNDWRGASEAFERAIALDPHHVWARIGHGTCAARDGRFDEARARWADVERDDALPPLLRVSGAEAIADLALALGDTRSASERYRSIAEKVFDEDHARALEVKTSPPHALAREAIVALLIGDPRLGRDWGVAAARLAAWSAEHPDQGEPDYLLGRNFYQQGRYREAAARLDRALERGLASPRVSAEALRTRLVVACALGDRAAAARLFARWKTEAKPRSALLLGLTRFVGRCGAGAVTSRAK